MLNAQVNTSLLRLLRLMPACPFNGQLLQHNPDIIWLSIKYAYQLQHVLVVQAAVDADLSLHLVVVQLRELASVVHLDRHLCASGLVNGQVHCGGIATAQLLRHYKLVDAPAKKDAQQVSQSCQDLQGAAVLAPADAR
jgi:hypothetical protein